MLKNIFTSRENDKPSFYTISELCCLPTRRTQKNENLCGILGLPSDLVTIRRFKMLLKVLKTNGELHDALQSALRKSFMSPLIQFASLWWEIPSQMRLFGSYLTQTSLRVEQRFISHTTHWKSWNGARCTAPYMQCVNAVRIGFTFHDQRLAVEKSSQDKKNRSNVTTNGTFLGNHPKICGSWHCAQFALHALFSWGQPAALQAVAIGYGQMKHSSRSWAMCILWSKTTTSGTNIKLRRIIGQQHLKKDVTLLIELSKHPTRRITKDKILISEQGERV